MFYRVRLGDNYIKLAFTLGLDIEQFRASNALWRLETVLPGRLLAVPPDQGVTFADYTVATGDDLASIAGRSKLDPWWIIRDNGLWDQKVAAGMTLRVRATPIAPAAAPADAAPAARRQRSTITYRVRAGDNLTSLSRRFGTTVGAIQAASGLGTRTRLVPGQRLRIPSS
jgi:membrane-bound lytic murein transglycosylase D